MIPKGSEQSTGYGYPVLCSDPFNEKAGLRRLLSSALEVGVETALVPGCLVLVDEALACHAVDDGHRFGVELLRVVLTAFGERLHDLLDVRAHHRAQARVVLAVLLRLAGALLGLCGIGHSLLLLKEFVLAKGAHFTQREGSRSIQDGA